MSWLHQMTTANSTDTVYFNIQSTEANDSPHVMTWMGYSQSTFDGYECTGQDSVVTQFTADTTDWPNRVQWGGDHHSWIRVTQPTGKIFHFYYRWTEQYPSRYPNHQHIDQLTVNFAPIPEDQEVAPETLMKWLERLGHDDAFLRVSYKMQKKMMKAVGHLPPWDPRKIEELEQKRLRWLERLGHDDAFLRVSYKMQKKMMKAVGHLPPWDPRKIEELERKRLRWRERLEELPEVEQVEYKDRLMERWGIEEIPPITPELLDQIAAKSRKFLEECLSPGELEFFDEHGHVKVRSREHSNIFYIVKTNDTERVERYINNELKEKICIHSAWAGLPVLDTCAMKVLFIKHAEEEFLRIGNMTPVRN